MTKQTLVPLQISNIQLDDLNLASSKLNTLEKQILKKESESNFLPYPKNHESLILYSHLVTHSIYNL